MLKGCKGVQGCLHNAHLPTSSLKDVADRNNDVVTSQHALGGCGNVVSPNEARDM